MIGKIVVSKIMIILSENPGEIMLPNRYWSCHQTVGAHRQRCGINRQVRGKKFDVCEMGTDGSDTVLRTYSVRI